MIHGKQLMQAEVLKEMENNEGTMYIHNTI